MVEYIANDGILVLSLQRIDESVTYRSQLFSRRRMSAVIYSLERHKHLVLDFQVGKGQLGRAVLVLRRRHELVDVFL